MVTELRTLMHDTVATPPHDGTDLAAVLRTGRRRVRTRRIGVAGGLALATAAVVTVGALAWPSDDPPDFAAAGVPLPAGPVLRLGDATTAVEGRDYRVLASYTNDNLNRDNGEYFDGVTDDGLILFREGQTMERPRERRALMDPATGDKVYLPDHGSDATIFEVLGLGSDRLVFLGSYDDSGDSSRLAILVFDRDTGLWTVTMNDDLPRVGDPFGHALGPDDRVYVRVPATQGEPPPGGWPMVDGEADDADAEGETYRLWSVPLDGGVPRDEGMTVGDIAFTDDSMVWTDSTNGAAGRVHVRDLSTGEESSFDPELGERCNLLGFGANDDRVVMSQYCGTYDGVRDDRVQVMTTDGDQVATVQGNGVEGALAEAGDALTIESSEPGRSGTYVYDLDTGEFLRVSDDSSSWSTSGPTPDGQFLYNIPTNGNKGMIEHLGELIR